MSIFGIDWQFVVKRPLYRLIAAISFASRYRSGRWESSEERKRLNHVFLAADRNFSDSEINDLIGGGWGQTRELLTRWVFNATAWTWRVIIFTTIVVCAWRLHNHTLK